MAASIHTSQGWRGGLQRSHLTRSAPALLWRQSICALVHVWAPAFNGAVSLQGLWSPVIGGANAYAPRTQSPTGDARAVGDYLAGQIPDGLHSSVGSPILRDNRMKAAARPHKEVQCQIPG